MSRNSEEISLVIAIVYSSLCIILLIFVSFHAWSIVKQQKSQQFQQQMVINKQNQNAINNTNNTIANQAATMLAPKTHTIPSVQRGKCCTIFHDIIPWFLLVWNMKTLYFTSLIHIYDIATDIGILIEWAELSYLQHIKHKSTQSLNLGNLNMFELFICAFFAFWLYRIITAFLIFNYTKSYKRFFLQLMDLEIYRCIKISHLLGKNKAGSLQRWLLKYEAIFESAPQAVLQLVYLINTKDFDNGLLISSLLFSFFSVAAKFTYDDATFFNENGKTLDIEFNINRICCCCKRKRKKKNNKIIKTHICKCCWSFITFNIGYISRYFFRICDVFSRMLIFSLLWTVLNGYCLMIVVLIEIFIFYMISYKKKKYNFLQYLVATYFDEDTKSKTINWCFYRRIENLIYLSIITYFINFYPLLHHNNVDIEFIRILILLSWIFSNLSSDLFFDTYHNMLDDGMQGTNERNVIKVIQNKEWDVFEELLEFGYKMNAKYHSNISPLQIYMKYVPIINLYHVTKMCQLGSNIYDTTNNGLNDNVLTLYVKQKNNIDIDFAEIKQLLDYEKQWKLENNINIIYPINNNIISNNSNDKIREISLITHCNNSGKNAFQIYIDSMTSFITFNQVKQWYDLGADPIAMNSEGLTPLEAYIKQLKYDQDEDDDINDLQIDLEQLCHKKLPSYSRYNAFDIYLNKFSKINCKLIQMWKLNQCIQQIKDCTDFNGDSIMIKYIKSNYSNNSNYNNNKQTIKMDINIANNQKRDKKVSFATTLTVNTEPIIIENETKIIENEDSSSSDTEFQIETIDDYHAVTDADDDRDHIDYMIHDIENAKKRRKLTDKMNKFELKSISSNDDDDGNGIRLNTTSYQKHINIEESDIDDEDEYNKSNGYNTKRKRTQTIALDSGKISEYNVSMLMELGVNCFVKDNYGMTAIHHYMKQKKISFGILKQMIGDIIEEKKYDHDQQCINDVNMIDRYNKTPLMYYLQYNESISIFDIETLSQMGFVFNKDMVDIDGNSVFHCICKNELVHHTVVFHMLVTYLDKDMDWNELKNYQNETPFMLYVLHNAVLSLDGIDVLLERGFKMDCKSKSEDDIFSKYICCNKRIDIDFLIEFYRKYYDNPQNIKLIRNIDCINPFMFILKYNEWMYDVDNINKLLSELIGKNEKQFWLFGKDTLHRNILHYYCYNDVISIDGLKYLCELLSKSGYVDSMDKLTKTPFAVYWTKLFDNKCFNKLNWDILKLFHSFDVNMNWSNLYMNNYRIYGLNDDDIIKYPILGFAYLSNLNTFEIDVQHIYILKELQININKYRLPRKYKKFNQEYDGNLTPIFAYFKRRLVDMRVLTTILDLFSLDVNDNQNDVLTKKTKNTILDNYSFNKMDVNDNGRSILSYYLQYNKNITYDDLSMWSDDIEASFHLKDKNNDTMISYIASNPFSNIDCIEFVYKKYSKLNPYQMYKPDRIINYKLYNIMHKTPFQIWCELTKDLTIDSIKTWLKYGYKLSDVDGKDRNILYYLLHNENITVTFLKKLKQEFDDKDINNKNSLFQCIGAENRNILHSYCSKNQLNAKMSIIAFLVRDIDIDINKKTDNSRIPFHLYMRYQKNITCASIDKWYELGCNIHCIDDEKADVFNNYAIKNENIHPRVIIYLFQKYYNDQYNVRYSNIGNQKIMKYTQLTHFITHNKYIYLHNINNGFYLRKFLELRRENGVKSEEIDLASIGMKLKKYKSQFIPILDILYSDKYKDYIRIVPTQGKKDGNLLHYYLWGNSNNINNNKDKYINNIYNINDIKKIIENYNCNVNDNKMRLPIKNNTVRVSPLFLFLLTNSGQITNIIKYLIECGAEPNFNCSELSNTSCLQKYLQKNRYITAYDLSTFYTQYGFDFKHKDKNNDNILSYSLKNSFQKINVLNYLIEKLEFKNILINNNKNEPSVLRYWLRYNRFVTVEHFRKYIEPCYNINILSSTNRSALHELIQNAFWDKNLLIYFLSDENKHKFYNLNLNQKELKTKFTAFQYIILYQSFRGSKLLSKLLLRCIDKYNADINDIIQAINKHNHSHSSTVHYGKIYRYFDKNDPTNEDINAVITNNNQFVYNRCMIAVGLPCDHNSVSVIPIVITPYDTNDLIKINNKNVSECLIKPRSKQIKEFAIKIKKYLTQISRAKINNILNDNRNNNNHNVIIKRRHQNDALLSPLAVPTTIAHKTLPKMSKMPTTILSASASIVAHLSDNMSVTSSVNSIENKSNYEEEKSDDIKSEKRASFRTHSNDTSNIFYNHQRNDTDITDNSTVALNDHISAANSIFSVNSANSNGDNSKNNVLYEDNKVQNSNNNSQSQRKRAFLE